MRFEFGSDHSLQIGGFAAYACVGNQLEKQAQIPLDQVIFPDAVWSSISLIDARSPGNVFG